MSNRVGRWMNIACALVSFVFLEAELYTKNIGGVAVFALFTGLFGGLAAGLTRPKEDGTE